MRREDIGRGFGFDFSAALAARKAAAFVSPEGSTGWPLAIAESSVGCTVEPGMVGLTMNGSRLSLKTGWAICPPFGPSIVLPLHFLKRYCWPCRGGKRGSMRTYTNIPAPRGCYGLL